MLAGLSIIKIKYHDISVATLQNMQFIGHTKKNKYKCHEYKEYEWIENDEQAFHLIHSTYSFMILSSSPIFITGFPGCFFICHTYLFLIFLLFFFSQWIRPENDGTICETVFFSFWTKFNSVYFGEWKELSPTIMNDCVQIDRYYRENKMKNWLLVLTCKLSYYDVW